MRTFDSGEPQGEPTTRTSRMRTFDSGATRDDEDGKVDYEGFLSPLVIEEFGTYMHKHRVDSDGELRASDNWQRGMPLDAYMKSLMRHVVDLWLMHRGHDVIRPETHEDVLLSDVLGGILFNIQGYWHTLLAGEDTDAHRRHSHTYTAAEWIADAQQIIGAENAPDTPAENFMYGEERAELLARAEAAWDRKSEIPEWDMTGTSP